MTASGLRRGLRHTVWAITVVAATIASAAFAQTYPARTVTIITPFAAGSQTDAAARLVGLYLQEALGGSFIIENKAGAGGLIAANTVARAKPDGYTLLLTTNSTHSAIALFKSVPYDPIKDFSPIARIGNFPSFLAVNIDLPITSMAELVAHAKANPGKLSYGVATAPGTSWARRSRSAPASTSCGCPIAAIRPPLPISSPATSR